jgi:hypothetical protein
MVISTPQDRHARRYCGQETSRGCLVQQDEGHLTSVDYPGTANDEHQYDGDGRRMRSKLAGAANLAYVARRSQPVAVGSDPESRPGQRCCREYLTGEKKPPSIPKGLLECLRKAGDNKEDIRKCFDKYLVGKVKDAVIDSVCNYIACYYMAKLIDVYIGDCTAGLCSFPEEQYCHECCTIKYHACICKVALKGSKGGNTGLIRCYSNATACFLRCT